MTAFAIIGTTCFSKGVERIFSAEGFSESFRDFVISTCGLSNPYTSTLNHYGTVDLGTMSYETPLSILIRRLGTTNPLIYDRIFGRMVTLPTLTQYIPERFYFESVAGSIYCSSRSGIPLVRYDLKDHGGVIPYTTMMKDLSEVGIDMDVSIRDADIRDTVWSLPFVHVYERGDFSVSFFAFQLYPETIRKALRNAEFGRTITGKFTMMVTFDANANQQLEIHIERKPGTHISASMKTKLVLRIIETLMHDSSEYRVTRSIYPKQTVPRLTFWPYGHPTYFSGKGKQQWVKKI